MASAGWPVQDALVTALKAALGPDVPVYSGAVEGEKPAGDYVVIPSVAEDDARTFGRDGSALVFTIHTWSPGLGLRRTWELWAIVRATLDRKPIAAAGHVVVMGRAALVDTPADPGGKRHGVIRYEARTQAAA